MANNSEDKILLLSSSNPFISNAELDKLYTNTKEANTNSNPFIPPSRPAPPPPPMPNLDSFGQTPFGVDSQSITATPSAPSLEISDDFLKMIGAKEETTNVSSSVIDTENIVSNKSEEIDPTSFDSNNKTIQDDKETNLKEDSESIAEECLTNEKSEEKLEINEIDGSVIRNKVDKKEDVGDKPSMVVDFFHRIKENFIQRSSSSHELNSNEEFTDKESGDDSDSSSNSNTIEGDNNDENTDQNIGRTSGHEHRFMGEGQTFKGKLIGVLEVPDARGDKMCQDALQELKTAIKASGEHKQRVIIHIAIDGLKIRDDKTGDCLYHHPVHKISFIAQDVSDNRAFGYIYGSPENGCRFFGIKTEKAASQVVLAMRDMFQVVFDLKKKEIDEAKTQLGKEREIFQKSIPVTVTQPPPDVLQSAATFPINPDQRRQTLNESGISSDLLGLEAELSHIQAGLQQIDKIAPNQSNAGVPLSFQPESVITIPGNTSISCPPGMTVTLNKFNTNVPTQKAFPQAIMNSGQVRYDSFGATPFLPPPPSKAMRQKSQDSVNSMQFINKSNSGFGDSFVPSANSIWDQQSNKVIVEGTTGGFSSTLVDQSGNQRAISRSSVPSTSDVFANLDPLTGTQRQTFVQVSPTKTSLAEMSSASGTGSMDVLANVGSSSNDQQQIFSSRSYYNPTNTRQMTYVVSSDGKKDHGFAHLVTSSQFHSTCQRDNERIGVKSKSHQNPSGYYTTGRPGLRFCAIPTVPTSDSPRSGSLKVSLPPESSTSSTTFSQGAITNLESSPRRIRSKHLSGDYFLESRSRRKYSSSSPDRNLYITDTFSIDPPPKLPEKPSRVSSQSPPPLPPKKPANQNSSTPKTIKPTTANNSTSSDIYDIPPDLSQNLDDGDQRYGHLDEIEQAGEAVEKSFLLKLSRMNVMELNKKIKDGKLPTELKGMTICEIMDYVSSKLEAMVAKPKENVLKENPKPMDLESSKENVSNMKPSFSDNFVSPTENNLAPPNSKLNKVTEKENESISSLSPGPPSAIGDSRFDFITNEPSPIPKPMTQEEILKKIRSISPAIKTSESSSPPGFEDNFSKPEEIVKTEKETKKEDRYAVLRELQMEDDMLRGWKTPSEEEKVELIEEKTDKTQATYYEPRVCSSEGSPYSRSDTNSRKSVSDDQPSITEEKDQPNDAEDESSDDNDSDNSQSDSEVSTTKESENVQKDDSCQENPIKDENKNNDNFESTFGPTKSFTPSKNWATFDDNFEGSSQKLSSNIRKKPLKGVKYFSSTHEDGFDSEKELSQYGIKQGNYHSVSRGVVSSQDMPYNSDHWWNSRKRSEDDSRSSYDENPFGKDTFTPPIDLESSKSNKEIDVFQPDTKLLEETEFKVHAAHQRVLENDGDISKSDAYNIFTIKDDPFDDDFFK